MTAYQPTVYLGTFDAERYWRAPHCTTLPEVNDPQSQKIVAAMDELMFPLCNTSDVLLTGTVMKSDHKDYLNSLGFRFQTNQDNILESETDHCIFRALLNKPTEVDMLQSETPPSVSVYANLPTTAQLFEKYGIKEPLPSPETTRIVNSKVYSLELSRNLGLPQEGIVARRPNELLTLGNHWLATGRSILIKDPFGVSGKGNLMISSEKVLKRISRYLSKQEDEGKVTEFIVEPFLQKSMDFSCQGILNPQGEFSVLSIQQMENHQLAFQGIHSAEPSFYEFLESKNYFETIEKVAHAVYQTGYFGNLCIDSMLLKDGTIVPVVEINARKSMGLLNTAMDCFLEKYDQKGFLTFFEVGVPGRHDYSKLLDTLKREDLLFQKGSTKGVIPLSANTLEANWSPSSDESFPAKGRLYCCVVANAPQQRAQLLKGLRGILQSMDYLVYS